MKQNDLVVILGPTATGKTKLASQLAYKFNGEIISADSRQVYKRMNIGSGKDYDDYIINDKKIPYHLIDIIEPSGEFNLFLFKEYFNSAFRNISARGKLPFLAGGTGLFLDAVLKDYNLINADFDENKITRLQGYSIEKLREILLSFAPELHNTTDLVDKERIIKAILIYEAKRDNETEDVERKKNEAGKFNTLVLGVRLEREEIKRRITQRLKSRLNSGMIEEVEQLVKSGISLEKLNSFGLEYKFIGRHLSGELNYNDMVQKLNSAINNFAKRQMTWFRKMEKEGTNIHWLNGPDYETAANLVNKFLNK